jgi:hypothetical protein
MRISAKTIYNTPKDSSMPLEVEGTAGSPGGDWEVVGVGSLGRGEEGGEVGEVGGEEVGLLVGEGVGGRGLLEPPHPPTSVPLMMN